MNQVAKIFMNGRSQAVRLPADFRFDCKQVYIHRDPKSGDIILSRKPGTWEDYFKLMDSTQIPSDFMEDREHLPNQKRDLF
ncbi:MAG: virulence associated protein VapB [Gammaproteobacteria bacterium]|nr:virulence associated protein VapB [Gammaproteobacteria bacterium]